MGLDQDFLGQAVQGEAVHVGDERRVGPVEVRRLDSLAVRLDQGVSQRAAVHRKPELRRTDDQSAFGTVEVIAYFIRIDQLEVQQQQPRILEVGTSRVIIIHIHRPAAHVEGSICFQDVVGFEVELARNPGKFAGEGQVGFIHRALKEGQGVIFGIIEIQRCFPVKCGGLRIGPGLSIGRARGTVDFHDQIAAADFDAIRQAQHDPAAQLRSNGQVGPVVRARLLVCRDDRHPEAPARCLEAGGVAGVEGGYFGREGTPHSSEQVHVVQFEGQQSGFGQRMGVVNLNIDDLARHVEARDGRDISEGLKLHIS